MWTFWYSWIYSLTHISKSYLLLDICTILVNRFNICYSNLILVLNVFILEMNTIFTVHIFTDTLNMNEALIIPFFSGRRENFRIRPSKPWVERNAVEISRYSNIQRIPSVYYNIYTISQYITQRQHQIFSHLQEYWDKQKILFFFFF